MQGLGSSISLRRGWLA